MKTSRLPLALLLLPASALVVAGCTQGSAHVQESSGDGADAAIQVVATTNVYRDIAETIGGSHVQATEIISSAAQDPHSYEPSARDKLTISKAQVVLANGGGYDSFVDQLLASLPEGEDVHEIQAVDSSPVAAEHESTSEEAAEHEHEGEQADEHGHEGHEHAEYNEHIWFDLDSMSALADTLAGEFGEILPEHAEEFKANAEQFAGQLDELHGQLESAGLKGKTFAMTEPVPFHLLEDAGMVDATPAGLSEAVESGGDIAPKTLKAMNDKLAAGSIDLLAYNTQTEGPDTISIRTSAEAHSVPVVDFTETMEPDEHYTQWIGAQIKDLHAALGG